RRGRRNAGRGGGGGAEGRPGWGAGRGGRAGRDRHSSLDLTETDLSALVADAVADAQAVEPKRPVRASTPASLIVVADEPRIRQVLANLLGNVREHTSPDTAVAVRLCEA